MAHDVLISYSSHDKLQAEAICNRLESRGIRCWIAPRDVGLGEYAESIVEAIEQAKVMVLVFSASADSSTQVKRELERAVSKGTTIVPVRIEEAEMSKSVEFYVSSVHWLDAITPPLEEHIDRLAGQLQGLLAKESDRASAQALAAEGSSPQISEPAARTGEAEQAETPTSAADAPPVAPAVPASAPAQAGSGSGWKRALGVVAGVVVVAALALFALNRGSDEPEVAPTGEETPRVEVSEPTSSTTGGAATLDVTFVNRTPAATAVFRVHDQGLETHYETLAAGQSWVVETNAGHEWVVRLVDAERRFPLVRCFAPQDDPCVALGAASVSYAGFVDSDGESAGAFVQREGTRWIEEGPDGDERFDLRETGRDEWSIYLSDASRAAEVQLDLWTGKVKYSDANNPQFDLYDIKTVTD